MIITGDIFSGRQLLPHLDVISPTVKFWGNFFRSSSRAANVSAVQEEGWERDTFEARELTCLKDLKAEEREELVATSCVFPFRRRSHVQRDRPSSGRTGGARERLR